MAGHSRSAVKQEAEFRLHLRLSSVRKRGRDRRTGLGMEGWRKEGEKRDEMG